MATSKRTELETAHPRTGTTDASVVDRFIGAVIVSLLAGVLILATALAMVYVTVGLSLGVVGLLFVWMAGAGVIGAAPTIANRLLAGLIARVPV